MVNLTKPVTCLNLEFVRRRQDACRFNGTAQGRRIDSRDFFVTETIGQAAGLLAAFIRQRHVRRAGKAIFSAQYGRAMAHHEDSRYRLLHIR